MKDTLFCCSFVVLSDGTKYRKPLAVLVDRGLVMGLSVVDCESGQYNGQPKALFRLKAKIKFLAHPD